jgi:ubiquinone/menaquinone biosynthesis C-methylase UbiE
VGTDDDGILAEQAAYYRARAAEYDRHYAERADLQELLTTVAELPIIGDVLELACGTGQWTPLLAARARSVTAVDASAEMLAIARERVTSLNVEFVQADVFGWQPGRRYDTVFFGFWLSHVPQPRMAGFWEHLAAVLEPDGRVVFVDDGPAGAAAEEVLHDQQAPAVMRQVDDGRRYRIVKVFHEAGQLTGALAALGWSAHVRVAVENYIVGVAEPAARP